MIKPKLYYNNVYRQRIEILNPNDSQRVTLWNSTHLFPVGKTRTYNFTIANALILYKKALK